MEFIEGRNRGCGEECPRRGPTLRQPTKRMPRRPCQRSQAKALASPCKQAQKGLAFTGLAQDRGSVFAPIDNMKQAGRDPSEGITLT